MVDTAIKDNKDWKIPDMKHGGSSQAHGPGSSQSQGSQGGSKGGGEKKRSPHQGLHSMTTRSQAAWKETPAELLHLARDHFAEGWSGRIVRGTYEGQRIVVKLAPTGSDRAEALLTEVLAYHKLKEYWGKYVPKLVSFGTTAGGKVVYIGTEEIDSREIGMGWEKMTLRQQVFRHRPCSFSGSQVQIPEVRWHLLGGICGKIESLGLIVDLGYCFRWWCTRLELWGGIDWQLSQLGSHFLVWASRPKLREFSKRRSCC